MRSDPFSFNSARTGGWRRLVQAVTSSPALRQGLHVCGECRADAVNPAHAEPLDEERWTMLLRCGACGATVPRVVTNQDAARYDHDLDRGCSAIASTLERIERARMTEWTEAFVTALGRDLIDAGDFACS